MVRVHQLFVGNSLRNFTYLVEYGNGDTICIDPTEAQLVLGYVKNNNLVIKGIINTHEHFDHTAGNKELVREFNCDVYCHPKAVDVISTATKEIDDGNIIQLDSNSHLRVLSTPGHTYGHICLILNEKGNQIALFSGDTLFNCGVGNCKGGGNVEILYETIEYGLSELPGHIKVYPGHEYIKNNVTFAKSIERRNSNLDLFYQKYLEEKEKGNWIVSTLEEEHSMNPFFRLDSQEIKEYLQAMRKSYDSREEVFYSLRELRDNW